MSQLTAEQIATLRAVPLGPMPNRIRIALALTGARQADLVDATGIPAPNLSRIVGGTGAVTLPTARKLADFFGCHVDDLFPATEAVA